MHMCLYTCVSQSVQTCTHSTCTQNITKQNEKEVLAWHPSGLDVLWADADMETSRAGESPDPGATLGTPHLSKVPTHVYLAAFGGATLFPFEDKEARCRVAMPLPLVTRGSRTNVLSLLQFLPHCPGFHLSFSPNAGFLWV